MPYGISDSAPGCSGWATVSMEDGGQIDVIACHDTKQEAVDNMVAASLAEGIEPVGEVSMRVTEPEEQWPEIEERAVSLAAPEFMQASAKRGLALHEEGKSGDGLVPQTVADARRMAAGEVSEGKWRKIGPWIARHTVDLKAVDEPGEITPGLVAMLLWGGGSSLSSARRAQEYAERIVERLDEEEDRANAPAPKSDQIKGSDKNEPGSAKDTGGKITLSDAIEKSLQNKASEHNDKMAADDRPSWTRVRVGALRSVWRRGAGAFSSSHRPGIGRQQWAMARVNAFLYLARTGRPENPKYVTDNDLLHPDHPRHSTQDRNAAHEGVEFLPPMAESASEFRWCVRDDEAQQRSFAFTNLAVRKQGDGNRLMGYAAVFDSPSEPMPFTEFVRRGAFSKTLNDGADVRLLIDHEGVPLARTKSGTLTLQEDETGLMVEADLDPANPDAQRVLSAMSRGDLSQMSFAFRTIKDSWSPDRSVRELREVQLFDVSVVTFPAYEQTSAELRSRLEATTLTPVAQTKLRHAQLRIARAKR